MAMNQERPRKLQRISQACDLCHRRSIRCRPSNEDPDRCQNCYDFDVVCTYDRPSKRKKHPQAPAAPTQPAQPSARSSLPNTLASDNVPASAPSTSNSIRNDSIGKANDFTLVPALVTPRDNVELDLPWKVFALSSEAIILDLFDVYMEVVYPLYPFFNEAADKAKVKNRQHLTDKGLLQSLALLLSSNFYHHRLLLLHHGHVCSSIGTYPRRCSPLQNARSRQKP